MPQPQPPPSYPKPASITGGCLCGAVRYRVTFPADHDFEANSGTCQCTQCRRSTGSLYFAAHVVPESGFVVTSTNGSGSGTGGTSTGNETGSGHDSSTDIGAGTGTSLREFFATPGHARGFCGACGSFLYWKDEKAPLVGFSLGTVDPDFLVGHGRDREGFGQALAGGRGTHCWCENEVRGVTDWIIGRQGGTRWKRGTECGETMP